MGLHPDREVQTGASEAAECRTESSQGNARDSEPRTRPVKMNAGIEPPLSLGSRGPTLPRVNARSIFCNPLLYEMALARAEQETERECTILRGLWEDANARTPPNLLEIGCGLAPHGQWFARRGYYVTAFDSSREMVNETQRRVLEGGLKMHVRHADARLFELEGPKFDAAIFMYQTFPLLLTNDAMYSHLRCVAACLKPSGIYVVDLDRDHDGFVMNESETGLVSEDEFARAGMMIMRRIERLLGDWKLGYNTWRLTCSFKTGVIETVTEDEWRVRQLVPANFEAVVQASGCFEVERYLSAYSGGTGIPDDEPHYFAVLRKCMTGA